MFEAMLRALVIIPNERTKDVGSLLAICRSEAKHKEHTQNNVTVRNLLHDSVTGCWVCVYEVEVVQKPKVHGHRGASARNE